MDYVTRFLTLLSVGVLPSFHILGMEDKDWRFMVKDLADSGLISGVVPESVSGDVRISDFSKVALTDKGANFLLQRKDGSLLTGIRNELLRLIDEEFKEEHVEIDFIERLSRVYKNLS